MPEGFELLEEESSEDTSSASWTAARDSDRTPATRVTVQTATGEAEGDEKALPQEQVNQLAGKIRKEAEQAALKKLMKKLGTEDLNKAAEILASHQQLQQESMTEVEKLTHERDRYKAQVEQQENKMKVQERVSLQRAFKTAAMEAIKNAGARNPDDVFKLMTTAGSFRGIIKDGKVDEKGIEKLVNTYKGKNKDYFKQKDVPDTPDNHEGRPRPPKRKPMKVKFNY